jgi:hypothetical protein
MAEDGGERNRERECVCVCVCACSSEKEGPPPSLWPIAQAYHRQYPQQTEALTDALYYVYFWVVLGILSSIGLGSGLHTFLIFVVSERACACVCGCLEAVG